MCMFCIASDANYKYNYNNNYSYNNSYNYNYSYNNKNKYKNNIKYRYNQVWLFWHILGLNSRKIVKK